ncbi:alpha/beta hydrolase [Magnetospirillum fulvum]|uniref:Lysophospholipase, alpha-beta hydrolase superfamily n=1 Tax=Magnetospirillum fulvum TaxID=1082 RepID=A0A1H6H3V9_MAGFU|nr:alpha/beta hydrolase [Magnetospirillum fulvum]SEH28874.1 Lysophospholipase, alpha-beta hydrolase superfamily [Magnetospirillum fulvum]
MVRLAAALLLSAVLLGGCIASLNPAGPQRTDPILTAETIRTADGAELPLRVWSPPDRPPRAVVLALHGMNDYSNAFATVGPALAAHGLVTYAYDQRGFGRGPHPGQWSDKAAMAADAIAAARLLSRRHPGLPLFLLGESMGGAVVIEALTMAPPPPAIAGAILSAPAVWGRASMGPLQRFALWLTNALVPGLTLTGRGLEIQPSDNIEMLRALSRDPLVIKETRIDAISGLVDLMDAAQADIARLPVAALVLYGEKDQVIPPDPMWEAIAALPRRGHDQRAALYPEGWHMLLRDLQAARVLDDIAAWTADPTAPLPSGADRLADAKSGQTAANTR